MIEVRIEPVSGARHPVGTPHLGREQVGHIRKGHPPAAARERMVGTLELLHEAAKRGALFQEGFVDRLEQREQEFSPEFRDGSPQVDAGIT